MHHQSTSLSLVCSNPIVSEGLKSILMDEDFTIVGQYKSCESLIAEDNSPDSKTSLILFDTDSSRKIVRDLSALHQCYPDAHIVVLHSDLDVEVLVELFAAGASGYILKEIACESLINCLQLAARGEKVVPGDLVNQLSHYTVANTERVTAEGDLSEILSERETATLRCLVMGYPNKVIARRLDIGEATVKVHVKAILRKLNVQNRTQAAICAVNSGMQAELPDLALHRAELESEDVLERAVADDREDSGVFMLADRAAPKYVASL